MPADGRGRQAEVSTEICRGHGTVCQHSLEDPIPGPFFGFGTSLLRGALGLGLFLHEIHN